MIVKILWGEKMTFKTITSFAITSACALLLTASCEESVVHRGPTVRRGNGPPAHAPAHGRRRKQIRGVELVFDSSWGVYVVVGVVDHYYHDGYFYRLHGGLWEVSLCPDRDWAPAPNKSLPPGLQAQGHRKGRGRGNGKNKKTS